MSDDDLDEDELDRVRGSDMADYVGRQDAGLLDRAVAEIRRRRAAQTSSAERVRSVVRESTLALLDERKLYVVKPQQPTMGEIALEAYGHGRACDAVALQGDDLRDAADAIADRVASQLAVPALSAEDRDVALRMRKSIQHTGEFTAFLDRLLGR